MTIKHDPQIADYLDYLEYNNMKRGFDTELIKKLRGACGIEEKKAEAIHDHDVDFREECAQEDRIERAYEEQGYQLAQGE